MFKRINIAVFLLGLPLLVYPFVLFGNFMAIIAHRSLQTTWLDMLPVNLFIFTSSFYPIVYVVSYHRYIKFSNPRLLYIPLLWLIATAVAMMWWWEWDVSVFSDSIG